MGKIKIEDLPEDQKISKEEMRRVFGGIIFVGRPRFYRSSFGKPINPYLMEPGDD